jgi:thiol:disulfide interchange protein
MKKTNLLLSGISILLITVAVGLSSFSLSNKEGKGINFFEGNFKAAQAKAKSEKKIIFLDAYAAWCGPCKRMAANVFTDPAVGEYFNKNFVNLKIDMEKGEGVQLSQQYQVQYYPTLFFIDANGKIIKKLVGYQDAAGLLKEAASLK